MKLLVDMNLSPRWVEHLQGFGCEAVHWAAVGPANASDAEILAFAVANNFIIITHDLDFSAVLANTKGDKPSVVQIRSEILSPGEISQTVVQALRQMSQELASGALLSVETERVRLRLLPIFRDPT